MSRSEIRDPFSQVARRITPEIQAVAERSVAQAAFGGGDTVFEQEVTRAGVDDAGNPVTTVGFTIGFSAIGGADGIGGFE